ETQFRSYAAPGGAAAPEQRRCAHAPRILPLRFVREEVPRVPHSPADAVQGGGFDATAIHIPVARYPGASRIATGRTMRPRNPVSVRGSLATGIPRLPHRRCPAVAPLPGTQSGYACQPTRAVLLSLPSRRVSDTRTLAAFIR